MQARGWCIGSGDRRKPPSVARGSRGSGDLDNNRDAEGCGAPKTALPMRLSKQPVRVPLHVIAMVLQYRLQIALTVP